MNLKRRTELASIHADILDAPFETFEHDGKTYHQVGLMQAWVRGYTDPRIHMTTEPPAWKDDFLTWITSHESQIREPMIGPPMIVFPSPEMAEEFRDEWHARARDRYPYEERERYEAARSS